VISAGNGFACVDGGAGPRRFVLAIVPGMPGMMGIRLLVFVVQVKESIPSEDPIEFSTRCQGPHSPDNPFLIGHSGSA
jgi:hypothetical protein